MDREGMREEALRALQLAAARLSHRNTSVVRMLRRKSAPSTNGEEYVAECAFATLEGYYSFSFEDRRLRYPSPDGRIEVRTFDTKEPPLAALGPIGGLLLEYTDAQTGDPGFVRADRIIGIEPINEDSRDVDGHSYIKEAQSVITCEDAVYYFAQESSSTLATLWKTHLG